MDSCCTISCSHCNFCHKSEESEFQRFPSSFKNNTELFCGGSAPGSASRSSPCLSVAAQLDEDWESWVWQTLRNHERILLKLCLSFSTTKINHHYSTLSRKVGEYRHAHFLGKWLINIIFHFYFCLNLIKKTQLVLKRKHRNNFHIFFFFNDSKFVTFRKKFLSIQIYNVNRFPYSLSLLPPLPVPRFAFRRWLCSSSTARPLFGVR